MTTWLALHYIGDGSSGRRRALNQVRRIHWNDHRHRPRDRSGPHLAPYIRKWARGPFSGHWVNFEINQKQLPRARVSTNKRPECACWRVDLA
jgi:hypothetical protein